MDHFNEMLRQLRHAMGVLRKAESVMGTAGIGHKDDAAVLRGTEYACNKEWQDIAALIERVNSGNCNPALEAAREEWAEAAIALRDAKLRGGDRRAEESRMAQADEKLSKFDKVTS